MANMQDQLKKLVASGKLDQMDDAELAKYRDSLIRAKDSGEMKMGGNDAARKSMADLIGQLDVRLGQSKQRETDLVQGAIKEAEDFDKTSPQRMQQEQALASSQGRRDLASTMSQIDKGASSRGLLYSGLRQGAQAQAAGQNQMQQAQARGNIASAYQQRGQDLRSTAMGAQLNRKQFAANQAYQNQQRQMQNQASQFNAVGQIGAGLGGLAGSATSYMRGK
jgi:hypothetical protein